MTSKMNKYKSRIKRFIAVAVLITGVSLTAHCVYNQTQIKGIKDSAEPLETKQYDVLNNTSGKSSSFKLFWFIPVTPQVNYNEAIDEAVLSGNGENLIDVRLYGKKQIWILGTVDMLYVEGKAIKYRVEKPEEKPEEKSEEKPEEKPATPSDSSQK